MMKSSKCIISHFAAKLDVKNTECGRFVTNIMIHLVHFLLKCQWSTVLEIDRYKLG